MMWCLFAFGSFAAEDITWSGIDYGLVHLVGTTDFLEPDTQFPSMMDTWNDLYVAAYVPILRGRLGAEVVPSIGHLRPMHAEVDIGSRIVREDALTASTPFLSRVDVVARVASYPSHPSGGMALTFVADQLSRPDKQGCYWVTWYDAASLAVHDTQYRCGDAGGVGFRNYWFGSAKVVTEQLPRRIVPDGATYVQLTEAELAAVTDPRTLAIMAGAREQAEQARRRSEEQARQAETQKNWVSVRVAPEGLALLVQNGVPFEVVQSQAAPASANATAPQPEQAECRTAYGKTACGYDCHAAFGDVKCAGHPGGKCTVAFGEITCSD